MATVHNWGRHDARCKDGVIMTTPQQPLAGHQQSLDLGLDLDHPPLESLHDAIGQLVQPLTGLSGRSFFDIDCAAAAIAGAVQMTGEPDDPRTDTAAVQAMVLTEILDGAVAGRQELIDAAYALATYGGRLRSVVEERLADLDVKPSPELERIGTIQVVRADRYCAPPGDANEIVLELCYPESDERPACWFLLDASDAMMLRGATMHDAIEELRAEIDEGLETDIVEELPIGKALAMISHGLSLLDATIDPEDLVEDEEVFILRPLIDYLIRSQLHLDLDYPTASPDERTEVVEAFVTWVIDEAPHLASVAEMMAPLMIDFAVDEAGGDPLRWSPLVAIRFLEAAATDVVADPRELVDLPELTRLMARWSHERKGWPASITNDTMSAIDEVEAFFDAELHQKPALAVEAPGELEAIDDSHPESFDPAGIETSVLDRAQDIAEHASIASRALFDDEYVSLVRRITADVARCQDTVFGRGRIDIWASAVVYAIAQLNDIPGGWNQLAIPASELTDRLAGAHGTITNKARELRQLLDVEHYQRPVRYEHSATRYSPELGLGHLGLGLGLGLGQADLSVLQQLLSGPSPFSSPAGAEALRVVPPSVDPASIDGDFYSIRVVLDGTRPSIWRQVRVPIDATFAQLHRLLQLTFGWYDCHLHAFDLDGMTIGPDPGDDIGIAEIDEADVRLCDILLPGDELVYTYDFGDNWEHRLSIEALEHRPGGDDLPDFACQGGARACPPEDCGGVWGYRELLSAMKDRNHPDRAELMARLPPGFDPKRFDAWSINEALRHWSE